MLKKTLALLSPLVIGVLVALGSGLIFGSLRQGGGLFLVFTLFYTAVSLIVFYAGALVFYSFRLAARRRVGPSRFAIFGPLLAGILLSLLVGVFPNPIFMLSGPEEPPTREDYFTHYGFPLSWRWTPVDACQQASQRFAPPLRCQAGFSGSFMAYDVLFFLAIYLLLSYASALFSKGEKWPIFLPRVSGITLRTGNLRVRS